MSEPWIAGALRPSFRAGARPKLERILKDLAQAPSPAEASRLLDELDELKLFLEKVKELFERGDLWPLLSPCREADGTPIPAYHVYRLNGWSAYFRLDHVSRVAEGITMRHDSDPPHATLKSVLDSL